MCAVASTVLRAVAADFVFNSWYLEIPSDNYYHLQRFRLENIWYSLLEVEVVPQNSIP
jgi:hypothetical protein